MAMAKSLQVLIGLGMLATFVLAPAPPSGAEELHYKFYTWMIRNDSVPVADVEGHAVALGSRGAFYVFDNGDVATMKHVYTADFIKGAGPFMQYVTITFPDGATITWKSQGTVGSGAGGWTSEILKGTGRFEGIKGTQSSKAKYLPIEPGEPGTRGYGEGTITYILPAK